MYGKVFRSMYQGSLRRDWQAMVVFQQLIVLADRHGVVDMTAEYISSVTGIPDEFVRRGLDALEKPDPDSRSPEEEGRRIVRLDDRSWGWRIVNYPRYRAMRDEAERQEQNRQASARRRSRQPKSAGVSHGQPQSAHAEGDVEAVSSKQKKEPNTVGREGDFEQIWDAYPHHRKRSLKAESRKRWIQLSPYPELSAVLAWLAEPNPDWEREGGKFVPGCQVWIGARGWETSNQEVAPEESTQEDIDAAIQAHIREIETAKAR